MDAVANVATCAPSLRFFMGGVMKSGRFVPSSFSPCALTQLPKNMPVKLYMCPWLKRFLQNMLLLSDTFSWWLPGKLSPVTVSSRPELTDPGLHAATHHELNSAQLFLTMRIGTGAAQHTILTVLPFVAQLLTRSVSLVSLSEMS